MRPAEKRPSRGVFGVPAVLAAVTIVGLVVGLLGEGIEDIIMWLALGACLATIAWHMFRTS